MDGLSGLVVSGESFLNNNNNNNIYFSSLSRKTTNFIFAEMLLYYFSNSIFVNKLKKSRLALQTLFFYAIWLSSCPHGLDATWARIFFLVIKLITEPYFFNQDGKNFENSQLNNFWCQQKEYLQNYATIFMLRGLNKINNCSFTFHWDVTSRYVGKHLLASFSN